MEHYRISMEKCKKAIEYRGDDFETVKSDFETGKTIVSDAQELLHIKQQIADIEKETRADRDEFDAQNALMNRLEGSIAHAVSQIKDSVNMNRFCVKILKATSASIRII